jgi:hypothetical protein
MRKDASTALARHLVPLHEREAPCHSATAAVVGWPVKAGRRGSIRPRAAAVWTRLAHRQGAVWLTRPHLAVMNVRMRCRARSSRCGRRRD